MATNLAPATLYEYIVGDFENGWNALAQIASATHRGNFMFARQAMMLLEFASRLCKSDGTGDALKDFSQALHAREPRYYTILPGACFNRDSEYDLPSIGANPSHHLLWAMFDLIRNGQAHQYQQILVNLADNTNFMMGLTGAERTLTAIVENGNRDTHLCLKRANQDVYLHVETHWLFLDIKHAIDDAQLLGRSTTLTFAYLTRPRGRALYQFNSTDLERSLMAHPACP